jgi:hypothetical protein
MKTLIALFAAAALMAPAFAADVPPVPMTKADCDKTLDMKWDATTKTCLQSSSASGASDGTSGADSGKTSDRTPGDAAPDRTSGASSSGAVGTDAGETPSGTSDRTPSK